MNRFCLQTLGSFLQLAGCSIRTTIPKVAPFSVLSNDGQLTSLIGQILASMQAMASKTPGKGFATDKLLADLALKLVPKEAKVTLAELGVVDAILTDLSLIASSTGPGTFARDVKFAAAAFTTIQRLDQIQPYGTQLDAEATAFYASYAQALTQGTAVRLGFGDALAPVGTKVPSSADWSVSYQATNIYIDTNGVADTSGLGVDTPPDESIGTWD